MQNEFLKIFFSVRWFQCLVEGLKSSSKVPSVCTDTFRFELFDNAVLKNTLLFSAPQGFLFHNNMVFCLCFIRKPSFLPGSRHFIFYLQSWIIKFETNSCRICSRVPPPPLAMFSLQSCKAAHGTLQVGGRKEQRII